MTWRILYFSMLALVLAGISHILIVLMVPRFGTRDASSFLSGRTDLFAFSQLDPSASGDAIGQADPFFLQGVCRFDLSQSAVRLSGPENGTFWSASVFDENGTVIYSLNTRSAIENRLDLLILNPLQILELRQSGPEEIETSVVIEANVNTGFVIVRVHNPDDSWSPGTQAFMKEIRCRRFEP